MAELVIVPDSDRVEQWLSDAASSRPFVDARGVCTFGQLVERCEPARWAGRAPVSPLLARFVLASFAPNLATRAFGPMAQTPDFAAHAHELITHLRSQRVTPAVLTRAASTVEAEHASLARRVRALAALWERLDAALEARQKVERSRLVELATLRLERDGLPPRLRGFAKVCVRWVHDFFPARLKLLEALAKACGREGVAFELWWPASGEAHTDVFVLDAVRDIEAKWQQLSAEMFPDLPQAPLAWVGEALFGDGLQRRPAPELTSMSAATMRDEARAIAAKVKRAIEEGTPPECIAVAWRDLADDVEAMVEALSDLRIPARARLGVPLLASPRGRLAFGLFQLADEHFPSAEFAELLEAQVVRGLEVGAASPRRAFAEAGLRDDEVGATQTQGAYDVRLAALEQRTREPAVGVLRASVKATLGILRALPEQARASEHLDAWWDCVTRLGLLTPAPQPPPVDDELAPAFERAHARDQASIEALGGLLGALREALSASDMADRPMTRTDFARHVRTAAQELNLPTRGPRTGAVWLLDLRELPGRQFERLFIGGLVDGRLPGRPSPLPLLSEDERAALNQAAKARLFRLSVMDGEVRLPSRLAEDRLLLHLALCAAPLVTLSHARLDNGGRELLVSPFLEGLFRCVEGFVDTPLPRRPVPTLDEVHSEAELRARVALEVAGPSQTRQTTQDSRRDALRRRLSGEAWLTEASHAGAVEFERLLFFTNPTRPAGPWSGQLDPLRAQALEARLHFGPDHPVSAAELGEWGQCAFRGMSRRVLGLGAVEATGEEADNRVSGTFWHDALAELVPELDKKGLLGRGDAPLHEVGQAVDEAVGRAARRLETRAATGHPALWELSCVRTRTILRRLVLRAEVIVPFDGARPAAVELDFGIPTAPVTLRHVVLPAARPGERDVHLRGRIDRIDEGAGHAFVLDYKTSVAQRRELTQSLLAYDFQLPVYLLAARQHRTEHALDAAWVSMRKRQTTVLSTVLEQTSVAALLATDEAQRNQMEDAGQANLATAIHGLLGRLRGGDVSARSASCRFCDFRPVCRISQRRLNEGE